MTSTPSGAGPPVSDAAADAVPGAASPPRAEPLRAVPPSDSAYPGAGGTGPEGADSGRLGAGEHPRPLIQAPYGLQSGSTDEEQRTLAFVESPVQLLNVLEWAHSSNAARLTLVVLPPHDPMTRGQLRRMAELARDEGVTVQWQEAREGVSAPAKTVGALAGQLRRARRVVIGDPFSRYVQLLLTLTSARSVVVVDDGTATMEFIAQLARGERFVRWHRKGTEAAADPRAALFAPFARGARRMLTPGGKRRVEVFSSMPVEAPDGVSVSANDFSWTRRRFGPPRLTRGTDLVGTSLVETGVVDIDRYLDAVRSLARAHGATRYFAHRRESPEKLHRVTVATGLEIVRPDLPLELVARRGPIGRTIVSFPSTVVHTLPLALAGTPVKVAVCEVDPAWLTEQASPRAQGFLSGVTGSARGAHRLPQADFGGGSAGAANA